MSAREEINEYDLGLPLRLEPLEVRKARLPDELWRRLQRAKEIVTRLLGNRLCEVRLFGSYARGDFDEDSDVDLLVVGEAIDAGERDLVARSVHDLSDGAFVFSPLVLSLDRWTELRRREQILAQDIEREGIAL